MPIFRGIDLLSVVIPAVSGILGAATGSFVAGWTLSRNNKREMRRRFVKQQLEEFYGPLLAIRSQIQANSELRVKISALANEEWPKLFASPETKHPDIVEQIRRERGPAYRESIEYANKQLKEHTLPSYREMVKIFSEKLYLAQPSTRNYLKELITFVEVWDQWVANALPPEVLNRLDHNEQRLYAFYEDLERKFTTMQEELRGI